MLLSFRRKKHNQVRDLSARDDRSHAGVGLSPLAKSLHLSTTSESPFLSPSPPRSRRCVASASAAAGAGGGDTSIGGAHSSPSTYISSLHTAGAGIHTGSLDSMSSIDVFDEGKGFQSLKVDVERFSQAVNQLRSALSAEASCGFEERGIDTGSHTSDSTQKSNEERIVDRIRWLGQVKNIVISVLNNHRSVHSTGIVSSLGSLMSKLIDDGESGDSSEKLLDSLENAFCASISEYMQAEGNESRFLSVPGMSRESSMESLLSESKENLVDTPFSPARSVRTTALSVDPNETAQMLIKMESGMDLMLEHAKVWSRFLKELVGYYEKKAQYKLDFANRSIKLTRSMRDVVTEIDGLGLPFFSSITLSLEQDLSLYRKWHDAYKTQLAARVLEPLIHHRENQEKQRKSLKESWIRHQKKSSESVGLLKKARAKYIQLCEECAKVTNKLAVLEREDAPISKLEKRSRQEEDLKFKVKEAEHAYHLAVEEANHAKENFEMFRIKKLTQMCETFHGNEQYVRKLLLEYVEIERDVSSNMGTWQDELVTDYSIYTIGSQFLALVRSYHDEDNNFPQHSRFEFVPYKKPSLKKSLSAEDLIGAEDDFIPRSNTDLGGRSVFLSPARKPAGGPGLKTAIASKFNRLTGGNKGDGVVSDGGSGDTKKGNTLPENKSPPVMRHGMVGLKKRPSSIAGQSYDEIRAANGPGTIGGDKSPGHMRNLKTGVAHVFKMMGEPFRVKDQEALMAAAAAADKRRPLARRPTFFGVDLARQCRITGQPIPVLVDKCIAELDKRGLTTHGLYRVSAAQTKCKELCRAFELKAEAVDLSDTPPHLIASVLKYYLRQLPQPLLTYRLYSSFINVAKKWQSTQLNALRNSQEPPSSHKSSSALNKTRRSVSLDQPPLAFSLPASSSALEDEAEISASVPRSSSQASVTGGSGEVTRKKSLIDGEVDEVLEDLRAVVEQLPSAFYLTAARVFHHLNRVASYETENSMSASNLSIVFGPNILKPRENETTTFSTLVDMQHQLRAVELLIRYPGVLGEKQTDENEESKEKAETGQEESSDNEDEVDPVSPLTDRRRSHSQGEILVSPPPAPTTPPMRKRQSLTEIEDLYTALTNANKDRLCGQRTRLSDDFIEEDESSATTSRQQKRFGRRGGDTSEEENYGCLLPGSIGEVRSVSKSPRSSPARSVEGLITPARLSPLGPSLYEHFDLSDVEVRKAEDVPDGDEETAAAAAANSSGSAVLKMLMQEAAKTAASTNIAAKHFSLPRSSATAGENLTSGGFEADILAELRSNGSEEEVEEDEDDEDDEAIIDLLITDHPGSPPPSADVVINELSGQHTSTLVEHVGGDESTTETSEMTVRQSQEDQLKERSPSPGRTASVIEGLMMEFNREIRALNTPPDSPRLTGRQKVVRRPKGKISRTVGKTKTATEATPGQFTTTASGSDQANSPAQSLDSLTSESIESSPPAAARATVVTATDPVAMRTVGTPPIIKVSSDSATEKGHIQIKTGWRGVDVEAEQEGGILQGESGISLASGSIGASSNSAKANGAPPPAGAAGSSGLKRRGREPHFV